MSYCYIFIIKSKGILVKFMEGSVLSKFWFNFLWTRAWCSSILFFVPVNLNNR